ncbi:MAG: hypothetical protein Q7J44_16770 [Pseudotabrizicola sp.]|uniref:hypothetical protein n=1 Tax=Pseudotabrizicola sp. TaxID=2939647 RepID=UPI002720A436|nr:hypothetical protein [Pseudotabrizicola sp.]MDO9640192.1 hypothetical protein [Pseudotabrizicola sp.]
MKMLLFFLTSFLAVLLVPIEAKAENPFNINFPAEADEESRKASAALVSSAIQLFTALRDAEFRSYDTANGHLRLTEDFLRNASNEFTVLSEATFSQDQLVISDSIPTEDLFVFLTWFQLVQESADALVSNNLSPTARFQIELTQSNIQGLSELTRRDVLLAAASHCDALSRFVAENFLSMQESRPEQFKVLIDQVSTLVSVGTIATRLFGEVQ